MHLRCSLECVGGNNWIHICWQWKMEGHIAVGARQTRNFPAFRRAGAEWEVGSTYCIKNSTTFDKQYFFFKDSNQDVSATPSKILFLQIFIWCIFRFKLFCVWTQLVMHPPFKPTAQTLCCLNAAYSLPIISCIIENTVEFLPTPPDHGLLLFPLSTSSYTESIVRISLTSI